MQSCSQGFFGEPPALLGRQRILTWVKEDDGFQAGVLVVIDLDLPQGLHQLVQDPGGHTSDFQLWAVHWDDEIIPWEHRDSPSGVGSSSGLTMYPREGFLIVPVPFAAISSWQVYNLTHE